MSEEYEDELVTSHSDENPELMENRGKYGPIAAASNEGSAVSELYKKDRQKLLGVSEKDMDHVVDYELYIPPEED